MKLKVSAGRVAIKKREAKLNGTIMLPPGRNKLYDIGEVVTSGVLTGYGPDGKGSTKEVYNPGDLVLFQLPKNFMASVAYTVQGTMTCFLHVADILARLTGDTIELAALQMAGNYVLLLPSVRSEGVIVLPDNATETRQERLHFSVMQVGKDVDSALVIGQEVYPDKGFVNPMGIDRQELAFVDQRFIYGSLATE